MNCLEYRRTVGAEPHSTSEQILAHVRSCPACAEFTAQVRQLDARIEAALKIPVPLSSSASAIGERWPRAPLALAASLLLAVTVGVILWLILPRSSLAGDLVEHVGHELGSLETTEPIPDSDVAYVLDKAQIQALAPLGRVTYAAPCRFRGHIIGHLVIDEGRGPVTVMVLTHEKVSKPEPFSEGGFTGVIVPAQRGAIAVLTRDESQVQAIASRLSKSVQ